MLELINGKKAFDITKSLLIKHNLLVKDLSKKLNEGEYLRIAVRDREDNEYLVKCLKLEMK